MLLLQIQTSDFSLQLKTEVQAESISELQYNAAQMVKNNPCVKGMTYLIAKYTKKSNGKFNCTTLKTGKVEG